MAKSDPQALKPWKQYDLSGNNKAVSIEVFPSLYRRATASLSRKLQIFSVSKGTRPNLHFYLILLGGHSGVKERPLLLREEWNEIHFPADFYLPSLAILNRKNYNFFHPISSIQYSSKFWLSKMHLFVSLADQNQSHVSPAVASYTVSIEMGCP